MMDTENSDGNICLHRGSERAASCVNTKMKSFKSNTCVKRSSSVYHRHPEFYPEKIVFRAKPVPANTYKSSDQLIKIQKRPYIREVKPFSFYERDQEIEKRKVERFLKVLEEEKKMRLCKARPVPTWLFKTTMSTPDLQNLQAQMQRKPRQLPKTQTIRTKNQAKIEKKEPIFKSIHIANQGGDTNAIQKEEVDFEKKGWKQQPIRESKKLCSTVPVQKKIPLTVPAKKKEPPMTAVQKKIPSRVPTQKKILSTIPAQKKETNVGIKKSIQMAVPKTKKDRKALVIRSKAEKIIKAEPNQTKRSFKLKQTTSEIFPNRNNKVKTDINNLVQKRRVVSSKVSEKIQKFELKKKPPQKETCMTQRKVGSSHHKKTLSKGKSSESAKFNQRRNAQESANFENNEADVIPAVPKNSLETLGRHSKNHEDLPNSFVNKSSIDYTHFFEELITMKNTLNSGSPFIQKVFTDVIPKQERPYSSE